MKTLCFLLKLCCEPKTALTNSQFEKSNNQASIITKPKELLKTLYMFPSLMVGRWSVSQNGQYSQVSCSEVGVSFFFHEKRKQWFSELSGRTQKLGYFILFFSKVFFHFFFEIKSLRQKSKRAKEPLLLFALFQMFSEYIHSLSKQKFRYLGQIVCRFVNLLLQSDRKTNSISDHFKQIISTICELNKCQRK